MAGDTLPEFQVELDNGSMLATSDLQGKVSVLVFFHTGCPDCQQELPVIQQLYDLYRANDSVAIYCISREEAAEEIEAYWQAHGLTLPYSAERVQPVFGARHPAGVRIRQEPASLQHVFGRPDSRTG